MGDFYLSTKKVCVLWNSSSHRQNQVCAFEDSSLRFVEFRFAFLRIQVCFFENLSQLRFVESKFASKKSSLHLKKIKFASNESSSISLYDSREAETAAT